MDAQERVTVRLSQAELVFLLRNVNVQTLPDLGPQPLGAVSPEAEDQLLEAAQAALLARGILLIDEQGQLKVDITVQSIVSACAFPEQLFTILFHHYHQPRQQAYFYRVPEFTVTHSHPADDIHELELTLTSEMGRAQIAEVFRLIPPSTARTELYLVSQNALAEAQRLSESGSRSGAAVLEAVVMPPAAAELLASALHTPVMRIVLHCIYQLGAAIQQRVLTIVADQQSCWLINADSLEAEFLTVQALPVDEVLQTVYAVHSPLLAPLVSASFQ